MKAQMLKIAGVKSDKEFYKKFPDEESFMKAHSKEFKKAMRGSKIKRAQTGIEAPIGEIPPGPGYTWDALSGGWLYTGVQPTEAGTYLNTTGAASNVGGTTMGLPVGEYSGATHSGTGNVSAMTPAPKAPKAPKTPLTSEKVSPYVTAGTAVIEGLSMIPEQKNAVKQAKQSSKLTGVNAQAVASAQNQPIKRQYNRPEDTIFQPGQMFPSYGVGTNVLARDGAEIANTFAPGNIYDDGGYEPLNDSERVKQFQTGGGIDWGGFANSGGVGFAGQVGQYIGTGGKGPSAGSKIGGGVGQAAGTAFGGPIGGMIGNLAGSAIGGLLDQSQRKINKYNEESAKNVASMMGGQVQQRFNKYLEDGGWVSHDWQPQVITQFGEHKLSDLLHPPHDADMLRAGGHLKSYTSPSEGAMETFAMGGDLKTMWGGYAEPMSYNPYLPDGGETVMFRGQSHDESDGKGNTGIGVMYGQNPVEVERGEPAVKLKDGSSGDESLVVYGNLKIPNQFLHEIGDPKAKGKKFKHYAKDLSKQEAKQNKIVEKASEQLDSIDVITPFDKLKFDSLNANIMGANMKLKDIAEKKMNAAAVQNAINDTAEELALDADHLSKGVVKIDKKALTEQKAKYGIDIPKAQNGINQFSIKDLHDALGISPSSPGYGKKIGTDTLAAYKNFLVNYMKDSGYNLTLNDVKDIDVNRIIKNGKINLIPGEIEALRKKIRQPSVGEARLIDKNKFEIFDGKNWVSEKKYINSKPLTAGVARIHPTKRDLTPGKPKAAPIPDIVKQQSSKEINVSPYKRNWMMDAFNQVLPYIRPSDAEPLDPMQLTGESYALSQNQLEPVWAQKVQPELATPYDISLQDIMSQNQADYNATQKMVGYNPAALAALNAQKYEANQKVLGEQFRLNQGEKDKVYDQNRNLLNEFKLKNLGILDQQYQRQSEALSKTKAVTQAALNSISSKIGQNKLENRTLQTYENMYNYRYSPNFRAINMNPLVQFDIPEAGGSGKTTAGIAPGYEYTYDAAGNIIGTRKSKTSNDTSRNGSIVKSLKNI